MRKTLAVAALLALVPAPAAAQEAGGFLLRVGNDTVSVERFARRPGEVTGRMLVRRRLPITFQAAPRAHRFHCHMIHEGRLFKCACPPFMPQYLARMGRNGYDPSADACAIHAPGDLPGRLKAFLFDERPLQACRNCMGYVGWQTHRFLQPEVVAHPERERVARGTHLDRRRFAQATALYYARRAKERLTGSREW